MRPDLLVAIALLVPCLARAEAQAPPAPPEAREVLRALFREADAPLPRDESTGCPGEGGTLGDYLALLVGNSLPAEGAETALKLSCVDGAARPEIMPGRAIADAEEFWICTLAAHSLDMASGDPWDYELRFMLRKAGLKLDRKRMWCPGTP